MKQYKNLILAALLVAGLATLALVSNQAKAVGPDVTINSGRTFASLDGSADDADGVVNGTFTVAGDLTLTNGGSVTTTTTPIKISVGGNMLVQNGAKITSDTNVANAKAADITINLTGGTSATFTLQQGGQITANTTGKGAAGAIKITAPNTVINGLIQSKSNGTGTGATQKPGGGAISVDSGCYVTVGTTGKISSEGLDPGADLVHIGGGCGVTINGIVQSTGVGHGIPNSPKTSCVPSFRPGKPTNSTACVEIWAGNNLTIANTAEVGADSGGAGGSSGTSWVDLFASGPISIAGPTSGSNYVIHANGNASSNDTGGTVTVKSTTGSVTATGKAIEASAHGNGGSGGTITIESNLNADVSGASLAAKGRTTGGAPHGGHVSIKSFNTVIASDANSNIDVTGKSTPDGTVALTACGAIGFPPGTVTPVTPTKTGGICGGAPSLADYVTLPVCLVATPQAHLKVVKQVVNGDGGVATSSDFTITVVSQSGTSTFSGSAAGTNLDITPGAYNVTETASSTYSSDFSELCSGTIQDGQSKVCTITNTFIPPQVCPEGQHFNSDHICVPNQTPICSSETELITNGGFEAPVVTTSAKWDIFSTGTPTLGWFAEWYGGATSFSGHTRPAVANVEIHQNGINLGSGIGNAAEGTQYAELDTDWTGPVAGGFNGEPASVAIHQTIGTVPTKNYHLKFNFAPRPGTGSTDNVLKVYWGGSLVDTIVADGSATSSNNWGLHEYDLTATTSSTDVTFVDGGTANSVGTFLDGVSLKCQNASTGPETGHIIINKVTNLEVTDQSFNFGINGDATSSTFSLTSGGSIDKELPAGSYNVQEQLDGLPSGWSLASSSCVYEQNESIGNQIPQGENVDLEAGDTVTCTFTNNFRPAETFQCSDNQDNDADNKVDAADPGCHSDGNADNPDSYVPTDNDETDPTPPPVCTEHDLEVVSDTTDTVDATNAVAVSPNPAWTSLTPGIWIWSPEALDATVDTSKTFTKDFTITGDPATSTLMLAADNGFEVSINGTTVATEPGEHNYEAAKTYDVNSLLHAGSNTITVTVTNLGIPESTPDQNPAGLLYKLDIASQDCPPPPVDVCPNIEGAQATIPEGDVINNDGNCVPSDDNTPPSSDLSVAKTVDDNTPDADQNITYTITATNNGPDTATNVVVTDILPSGLSFVATSSSDTVGVYDSGTGAWTIGSLADDESATLHITVQVTGEADQVINNTASITGSNTDPDGENNSGSASVTVNTPTPPSDDTPPPQGGGSFSGGGGSGFIGGAGQVLGTSTDIATEDEVAATCGLYLTKYIKKGAKNDPVQVRKLQVFLNKELGLSLTVNGIYDTPTWAAVNQFQLKYFDSVLTPWVPHGLPSPHTPTGYVYKTTRRWINVLSCPALLPTLPVPILP